MIWAPLKNHEIKAVSVSLSAERPRQKALIAATSPRRVTAALPASSWDSNCSIQAHEAETQAPVHPRVEAEVVQAHPEDPLPFCCEGH